MKSGKISLVLYRPGLPAVILMLTIFCIMAIGRDFKGAEYRTVDEFTYGRFEARIKAPATEGVLSSFFTYHEITESENWSADWNEIDIEILGRYEKNVQFNVISPGRANHVRSQPVEFNPSADYHIYAFEWTPEYIAWFLDGQEYYRQTGAHISSITRPQKLMMNIWNPIYDNWVGEWNPKILPVFALYDWVKYASYTPESGNTGTDYNFTLQWHDEFDDWDQNRWEKSTHTFEGNNCDFLPDNVAFYEGNMILCLTDNNNTGYVDKSAPAVLWARCIGDQVSVMFSEKLDPVSAGKPSNYKISSVTIDSVRLDPGGRKVSLNTGPLDHTSAYNLAAVGIVDANANKLLGQVVPVYQDEIRTFPFKINFGGSEITGYEPAVNLKPESAHGYLEGKDLAASGVIDIIGTEDDQLYRTTRDMMVSYIFRLANGQYNIVLKFCENKFENEGDRIFDIYVQKANVVPALDLVAVAGKHTAHDISFDQVVVNDHELEITFAARVGEATISAIEIYQDPSTLEGKVAQIIREFRLAQNYPNPFNSSTNFEFNLPVSGHVNLEVFDSTGRLVAKVLDGAHNAGKYNYLYEFNQASGVYFYRLAVRSDDIFYREVKKMILLR